MPLAAAISLAMAPAHAQNDEGVLESVIVTAQKREERLQDVPVPVAAISAASLASVNQPQLRDYFSKIPGLNLTEAGIYGGSVISIRGITSGIFNDGTTAVVFGNGINSQSGRAVLYVVNLTTGAVIQEIDRASVATMASLHLAVGTRTAMAPWTTSSRVT